MALFTWLENTPIGIWVRESAWGFPIGLILHVWSMAFVVGISLLLALSVFGLAPRLLPTLLAKYLPVTWTALGVSLASGVLLLSTYPATVLTSEVFYLKMLIIAAALSLAVSLQRRCAALPTPRETPMPLALKLRAAGILLAWFSTIVTGRLLYYTY